MMPKISDTERAALNAGTVGFDRNIFCGNPSSADLAKVQDKLSNKYNMILYYIYDYYFLVFTTLYINIYIPGGRARHNFPCIDLPAFIDPIKTTECVCVCVACVIHTVP